MMDEMQADGIDVGGKSEKASGLLCAIFFLSGAAALIFESLWFRLAGLTFGNSVWASALVLSSFMAGLALGNGLAVIFGYRIRSPIRFYASVETVVAVSGVLLVVVFPYLTGWLAPLFRHFLDQPWVLNPLRLLISFFLMVIPATAMGLTLPLLVKALYRETPNYGRVLGKLYGWNTLGAVAGALLAELLFVEMFGVRGAGFCAGLFNMLSALGALRLASRFKRLDSAGGPDVVRARPISFPTPLATRILLAGFLSGGILLALEVVWFRFLLLYLVGESLVFAIMLAVVLAGIGIGGMVASLCFRYHRAVHQYLWILALLNGALCIGLIALFEPVTALVLGDIGLMTTVMPFALMFPVCVVSGMLFTLIGQSAHEEIGGSLETTGMLTMVNTAGATLGSALGGFVLLPKLGMEKSFFLLSAAYLGVGLLTLRTRWVISFNKSAILNYAAAAILVVALVFFPFGAMQRHLAQVGAAAHPSNKNWTNIAIREGLTETSQLWEMQAFGKRAFVTLYTNSFSMSSTFTRARRYMKFYAYLPICIHPNLTDALLICYGVGSTAKAITDSPDIRSIDVVDISRDIIDNSRIIFPDENEDPLQDPRVNVHIEDGRFFLQTTEKRYDLITAEPPPPLLSGVVNLYSQEYFQLIFNCLKEGGMATYWLPVRQLGVAGTSSIIKAFQNVFEDCTLWAGNPFNWMLVGVKKASGPVTEEHFSRLWRNPVVAAELGRIGFEKPEQIGATLILDDQALDAMTRNTLPVTDNYPKRIPAIRPMADYSKIAEHFGYSTTNLARARFLQSSFVRNFWPESLRERTLPYFHAQELVNEKFASRKGENFNSGGFVKILRNTTLRFPVKFLMGGFWALDFEPLVSPDDPTSVQDQPDWHYYVGIHHAANRDLVKAADEFEQQYKISRRPYLLQFRVLMLCVGGYLAEARATIQEYPDLFDSELGKGFVKWLSEAFGLENPFLSKE